jgi:isopentenyldiphosphate isomerase
VCLPSVGSISARASLVSRVTQFVTPWRLAKLLSRCCLAKRRADKLAKPACYPKRVDELLDVLDEYGRPTGEVAWKSEAHRRGLWHRGFHCWIAGENAGVPYLLVQRRDATKDTWPGFLDITAAGHLQSGEEVLSGGQREIAEELGLKVKPSRLVPLGTRRVEQEIPGGCDREFHDVYLLIDSTPPEDLRLQRGEVEAVLRIELGDAERLGTVGSVPAVEYAEGKVSATRVRLSDFVPNTDDYLRRVAGAARQLLRGESPGRVF